MTPHERMLNVAREHLGKRFIFYGAVSGLATIVTQIVLILLHGVAGWRASIANIIAVCVATPISYFMNRAWVWKRRGKSHLGKEVAPFWAFSFAGLLLSTLLVGIVSTIQGVAPGQRPTPMQQLQINLANMLGFGILWLIQFFVLDKYSFVKNHHGGGTDEGSSPTDGGEAGEPRPPEGRSHDEVLR